MNLNAHIFIDRLKLPADAEQVVMLCPFHLDSGKSFSVHVERGVFFCHGGCDEPKGGGAIEFLLKWAKYVDKKPITRDEARRTLHRTFTIPNAKTLRQEQVRDEVQLFARRKLHVFADRTKETERRIAFLSSLFVGPPPQADQVWDDLATLHQDLQWYEWAFDVCLAASGRKISNWSPIIACWQEAKARGLWDGVREIAAASIAHKNARRARILNNRASSTSSQSPPLSERTESSCHVPQSPATTKRTPVPVPKRNPVK